MPANLDTLMRDIDRWVEDSIENEGEGTPDFWDELNTSERLAEYLWKLGYRKVRREKEEI